MERLPYIDQHSRTITADPEHTWAALLRSQCSDPTDPSTVPRGFVLDAADPPRRLALRGEHPFSRYSLVFSLSEAPSGGTTLTAETRAVFPGRAGRVYQALVIGSGGHRLIVRHLLRRIAASAERARA
ncbi:hypothetical protein [Nocardia blacklockiae]|uniref:hypothetical protein n=1 Tax=Nocardia blacklockiae TaxID=480036 RepID=UPI0018952CB1|nr:hypothetical protein [Nocardia blacklockiae]MBF6173441.1 hypothetical protein [Nocardia blacklockiae]